MPRGSRSLRNSPHVRFVQKTVTLRCTDNMAHSEVACPPYATGRVHMMGLPSHRRFLMDRKKPRLSTWCSPFHHWGFQTRPAALTACVILLASPSLSLAGKGDVQKTHKGVVPCRAKIEELVCTDDPDCQWDAKKSKCNKTNEGKDRCSGYESEFYCEANKCNWHRRASKCSTKPSPDY